MGRSQSGKTYLEKHYESFSEASEADLIMHALRALSGSVAKDEKLTKENGSIAIVGKNKKFTLIEEDKLQPYLDRLELEGGVEESPEGDAEEAEESGGDEEEKD